MSTQIDGEIVTRAERRIGELLREQPVAKPRTQKAGASVGTRAEPTGGATLADTGVTKRESARTIEGGAPCPTR